MAEKNITRKQALENAINMFAEGDETRIVLEKMLAQLSKPRKQVVSKARKMNENLAQWAMEHTDAEGMTTKQLVALGNPEILTTQKASAVLRVACDLGKMIKITEGKAVIYKLAE